MGSQGTPLTTWATPPGDAPRQSRNPVGVVGGSRARPVAGVPAAHRHEADAQDGPVPSQGLGAAQREEAQLLVRPKSRGPLPCLHPCPGAEIPARHPLPGLGPPSLHLRPGVWHPALGWGLSARHLRLYLGPPTLQLCSGAGPQTASIEACRGGGGRLQPSLSGPGPRLAFQVPRARSLREVLPQAQVAIGKGHSRMFTLTHPTLPGGVVLDTSSKPALLPWNS